MPLPETAPQSIAAKILTAHSLDGTIAAPGRTLRIAVDWILASELALAGMDQTFARLGRPPLADPARFFLAIDHTVDPHTIRHDPKTQALVRLSRDFAKAQRIAAFYDANQTIMHTAFYRNHAVPGSVVLGADSHSTSHGAVGAFAFGLGGADVAMAAVTGETWITMPQEVLVRLRGRLPFGLSGKDVALATLARLGCNRRALERIVEYRTDPGAPLSLDARFTLCNMTTELGGIAGIFAPDAAALGHLHRFDRLDRDRGHLLASDTAAIYADGEEIDLSALVPQIALPFSPDNVHPVTARLGQPLDGCFIGACTTTEEELILAALLLDRAMAEGARPVAGGKRLVVPGDVAMRARLEERGLMEIYRRAGFRVAVPGCHLCLGLGSERAGQGEVWLTSQNRNFRNRMGAGSLAWLASAVTVAAGSLGMAVADPRDWLAGIDRHRLAALMPPPPPDLPLGAAPAPLLPRRSATAAKAPAKAAVTGQTVTGRALCFGDNIDTDAIIPGEFCNLTSLAELGAHCFHYTRPEMRGLAAAGQNIIVAGHGWGCGSSREHAAWALKGAGVRAVIARSFAVIHRRNLVNEGLPVIVMRDEAFFATVDEGDALEIDARSGKVYHPASGRRFHGEPPAAIEAAILGQGGLIPA